MDSTLADPGKPYRGRAYDPNWEGVPEEYPIVVNNLDPDGDRIVSTMSTTYSRSGNAPAMRWSTSRATKYSTNCIGCHTSQSDMVVPAGQLDLEAVSSDIDLEGLRSYRELLNGDNEQWIDNAGNVTDRLRLCTGRSEDEDGNIIILTFTRLSLGSPCAPAAPTQFGEFFDCFEGGNCGLGPAPALPANCVEDGGIPEPARSTRSTTRGCSAAELRLISEWLDIGAQYYNNPFDGRLVD